jgi:hypothetical protein
LFTSTSSRPYVPSINAAAAATAARSVTSSRTHRTAPAVAGSAAIRAAAASPRSRSRAPSSTVWPAAAICRAASKPIPLFAPVIRTILVMGRPWGAPAGYGRDLPIPALPIRALPIPALGGGCGRPAPSSPNCGRRATFSSTKRIRHPVLGWLELGCEGLHDPYRDQWVIFYTAAPGTPSAEALGLLRVIGTQDLALVMSTWREPGVSAAHPPGR